MFTVRQTQHTDVHVTHFTTSPFVTSCDHRVHSRSFGYILRFTSRWILYLPCRCHLMFYIFYVLPVNNFWLLVLSIYVSPSTRYWELIVHCDDVIMSNVLRRYRVAGRACVYVRCCTHVLMMHHALSSACRAGVAGVRARARLRAPPPTVRSHR